MNTFGHLLRLTSFGESHGVALGAVIDGCPAGIELSESDIQIPLNRRRPGQSLFSTPRQESDQIEILSGIFRGKTTGTPITVMVRNQDQRSGDYDDLTTVLRPSHADFGWWKKFGHTDPRGGGRSSGRETLARVIGGAVAQKILQDWWGVEVFGFTQAAFGVCGAVVDRSFIEKNPLRMADPKAYEISAEKIKALQSKGDSAGGVVEIRAQNVPPGWGSPVFGKLESALAGACLSVGAVKGFEMGEGFALSGLAGSQANDPFVYQDEKFLTQRNANGGVLGGISTGEMLWFRAAIKPTSSISQTQNTVNKKGEPVSMAIKGRHDPIIVPRVVPVLEAMTALVLADQALQQRAIAQG